MGDGQQRRWRRRARQQQPAGSWRNTLRMVAAAVAALAVVLGAQYWLVRSGRSAEERAAAQVDLETFSIYLHHQGCPGSCPIYAVLARGDGQVEYEGVQFVTTVGAARAELDELQVRALALAALRAGITSAPAQLLPGAERCREWDEGRELLTIGARFGATTHTVAFYPGCKPGSPELELLAREIDGIVGSGRWTKPGGAP